MPFPQSLLTLSPISSRGSASTFDPPREIIAVVGARGAHTGHEYSLQQQRNRDEIFMVNMGVSVDNTSYPYFFTRYSYAETDNNARIYMDFHIDGFLPSDQILFRFTLKSGVLDSSHSNYGQEEPHIQIFINGQYQQTQALQGMNTEEELPVLLSSFGRNSGQLIGASYSTSPTVHWINISLRLADINGTSNTYLIFKRVELLLLS